MPATVTSTQLTPDYEPRCGRDHDRVGPNGKVPGEHIAVGEFVSTTLVTDTISYEVVAISASGLTLRLRPTRSGGTLEREDNGSPYPVVWSEVLPNPDAETFTVRRSKTGFFGGSRGHRIYRSLHRTPLVNGKPATRRDWSF